MNRTVAAAALLVACVAVLPAAGAEQGDAAQMTPEQMAEMQAYVEAGTPGPEHKKMAESAGTYDMTLKSWHDPSAPPMEETGTATRKMTLDGRVMVEEVTATMMGSTFTGIGMYGYDNVTGKHWSTWMDSMSTGMMASEGTCDSKDVCTFVGSWNDPVSKKPITARMVIRKTGAKTELFEMYGPGKDGKEHKLMEIVYTKK